MFTNDTGSSDEGGVLSFSNETLDHSHQHPLIEQSGGELPEPVQNFGDLGTTHSEFGHVDEFSHRTEFDTSFPPPPPPAAPIPEVKPQGLQLKVYVGSQVAAPSAPPRARTKKAASASTPSRKKKRDQYYTDDAKDFIYDGDELDETESPPRKKQGKPKGRTRSRGRDEEEEEESDPEFVDSGEVEEEEDPVQDDDYEPVSDEDQYQYDQHERKPPRKSGGGRKLGGGSAAGVATHRGVGVSGTGFAIGRAPPKPPARGGKKLSSSHDYLPTSRMPPQNGSGRGRGRAQAQMFPPPPPPPIPSRYAPQPSSVPHYADPSAGRGSALPTRPGPPVSHGIAPPTAAPPSVRHHQPPQLPQRGPYTTGNSMRDATRKSLYDKLVKEQVSPANPGDWDAGACTAEIEDWVFATHNNNPADPKYNAKMRSLIFNLGLNVELIRAVLSRELSAEDLCNLTQQQLANPGIRARLQQQPLQHPVQKQPTSMFQQGMAQDRYI